MTARPRGARAAPWVIVAGGFHQAGGMDRANSALADYLLDGGVLVHLVAHRVDEAYARQPAVRVHLVPRPAGSILLGGVLLRRTGHAVARQVTTEHAGARVVVNGGNCAWSDLNWVHSVHHAWPPADRGIPLAFRLKNRVAKAVAVRDERAALSVARLVIANSERTRRDVLQHFRVDPARVHTVCLGCDPSWGAATPAERLSARAWLGVPDERPLVAFVGAIGRDNNKGLDTLWGAWRVLCTRPDWDADLIVAGDGAVGTWRHAVARAGLAHRVRFLGFTDRIAELLGAADLLVSPVRYEAYGLNVQEALCRGVPALVSASAGVAEQFPAALEDMLLRDPEDVSALAHALLRWRADVSGWKARVRPVSEKLRAHTWSDMARRIVELAHDSARRAEPTGVSGAVAAHT
ncbi:MAG: glycosyltransferase family 4 protein [Gemmatimonadaceae bacterium]